MDNSFTDPPATDIYTMGTIPDMVLDITKEKIKSDNMGSSASNRSYLTPTDSQAHSPPKKKRVPWNKGFSVKLKLVNMLEKLRKTVRYNRKPIFENPLKYDKYHAYSRQPHKFNEGYKINVIN